jgi:ribonucleotide reductase alpha subunit
MPQYNDFRDLKVNTGDNGVAVIKVEEDTSRIALCTLSAINLGNIKALDDIEGWMNNAVRGLDQLLSYQDYLLPAAREATLDYRPLGIGLINLAYYFAKNNVRYDDPEAWQLMHETMESIQFYGIKASIQLAKEKGPCRLFERTKYGQGLLPIDHYNKNVDEIVKPKYNLDWEWLREELKQHGIRNATITALMPAECQSLENKILLAGGKEATLEDIIRSNSDIDIEKVHQMQLIGERFYFNVPVELFNSTAYSFYYNGPASVTEIEFEDGSIYKFTNNHKLLVLRNGQEQWITVDKLVENDEIISVNA